MAFICLITLFNCYFCFFFSVLAVDVCAGLCVRVCENVDVLERVC